MLRIHFLIQLSCLSGDPDISAISRAWSLLSEDIDAKTHDEYDRDGDEGFAYEH